MTVVIIYYISFIDIVLFLLISPTFIMTVVLIYTTSLFLLFLFCLLLLL